MLAFRSCALPTAALFLLAPVALVLGSTAVAQQTWVVAPQAGPGVNFTSLPAAVQAAQSGDTLLLRAGTYSAFTTSKGIEILGDSGVTIAPSGSAGIGVVSLPAGETFAMRNVTVACPSFCSSALFVLQFNQGRLHFDDVRFSSTTTAAFRVNACSHLTMTRCSGSARGCLNVQSSDVALVDCTFLGEIGVYLIGSPPAIDASTSRVRIAGGTYRGGDGGMVGFIITAAPGLVCRSGSVTIAGSSTAFEAGVPIPSQGGVSAIQALSGGVVDLEPAVQLTPQNGGAPFAGNVNVRRIPSVVGSSSASAVPLTVHAPQGHLFGLYAGFPAGPTTSAIGELWLDESTAVVLVSGVVGPTEQFGFTLNVPGTFDGLPLTFQAVTFDLNALGVSTPCTVVVR